MTNAVQNLEQMSIRELTDVHNALAVTLEQPQIKRVESKAKGIEKIQALQALIEANANGATGDSPESEFSESDANAELNAEQGATEPANGVETAAESTETETPAESDAAAVEQPESSETQPEQTGESETGETQPESSESDEETDENEEEHNAQGNAAMAAMVNPGAALQGVLNVVNAANAAAAAKAPETPAAPVAKKPASNAQGVSDSWNDPDIANARRTRHSVFVECEGVTTSHKSVPMAFRDLRIPMTGLIKFRLEVKADGAGTYEYNGKKYNFTVDQVYGPNAPKKTEEAEKPAAPADGATEQPSSETPASETPQMPQDTDLGETNTGEQAAA